MAQKKKKADKKKVAKKKTAVKKKSVTSKTAKKKAAVKKKSVPQKTAKKKAAVKRKPSKPAAAKKASPEATAKGKSATDSKKLKVVRGIPPRIDPAVEKVRNTLLQNRAELLKLIRSSQAVERDVGEITFSNEIDLASSLEGREMLFQLSSRDRNELRLIEDALFNIGQGTYGICQSCSKRISLKRLQILPLTTLCIECQESMER